MRASIENGEYTGWDDPRLPTLQGLKLRGIQPEALRNFWIELGVTQKDISVPLATLFSHNTKGIDDDAPRLSFVRSPVVVSIHGDVPDEIEIPVHPNHESMGKRIISMQNNQIMIEKEDAGNPTYRLKEFADINEGGQLGSISRSDKRSIIHWVSADSSTEATLTLPLQENIEHIKGRVEHHNSIYLEIHKQILWKVGVLLNRDERRLDSTTEPRIEAA